MYILNKPAKYGIKVYVSGVVKTHYAINAEIYSGYKIKVVNATKPTLSNPTRVVLRFVYCVKGSNSNLTGDKWYSSMLKQFDVRGNSEKKFKKFTIMKTQN